MKFGRVLEYNMRIIFLEKSFSRCDRETVLRPIFKRIKIEHISGSIFSLFLLCAKWRAITLY